MSVRSWSPGQPIPEIIRAARFTSEDVEAPVSRLYELRQPVLDGMGGAHPPTRRRSESAASHRQAMPMSFRRPGFFRGYSARHLCSKHREELEFQAAPHAAYRCA